MNTTEFDRRARAAKMKKGSPTDLACRLVLIKGLSQHKAADKIGVNVSVVCRGIARLSRELCPECGNFK